MSKLLQSVSGDEFKAFITWHEESYRGDCIMKIPRSPVYFYTRQNPDIKEPGDLFAKVILHELMPDSIRTNTHLVDTDLLKEFRESKNG